MRITYCPLCCHKSLVWKGAWDWWCWKCSSWFVEDFS